MGHGRELAQQIWNRTSANVPGELQLFQQQQHQLVSYDDHAAGRLGELTSFLVFALISRLVTLKLREFTLELREIRKRALENLASSEWLSQKQKEEVALKAVRQRKDEQMAEVYR